jgi:hypothetical protein
MIWAIVIGPVPARSIDLISNRSFFLHSNEDFLCLLTSEITESNEYKANECMLLCR